MNYPVGMIKACRVARCDSWKLEPAIAAGYCPWAPTTDRFMEDDVIGLYAFSRLLEMGLSPRVAGQAAEWFMREAPKHPYADRISNRAEPDTGVALTFDVHTIRSSLMLER